MNRSFPWKMTSENINERGLPAGLSRGMSKHAVLENGKELGLLVEVQECGFGK